MYVEMDERMQEELDNMDLPGLLEGRGYQLKRTGANSYNMILDGEVASLAVFYSRSSQAWRWKRHSQNLGGGAISLLSHLEGLSWKESVETLLGQRRDDLVRMPGVYKGVTKEENAISFALPGKNRQCLNGKPPYSRLFGYLCNRRGIERDIVREMVENKLLYLSHEKLPQKDVGIYNCIFVGHDEAGKARWAAQKGTGEKSWAGTVAGSDPAYAFHIKGSTNTIRAFEAPIDLLSYLTMCRIKGVSCNDHLVAQGGLFDHALKKQLECNTEIKRIVFCLDNDANGSKTVTDKNGFQRRIPWNHGQKCAEEYCRKYGAMGYECEIHTPKEGKDWNDVLLFYRQMEAGLESEEETEAEIG